MNTPEFDRSLFEKFVNRTYTKVGRRVVESWFDVFHYAKNLMATTVSAGVCVWNKIPSKTKIVKEKENLPLSTLGKMTAVFVALCAAATYFLLPQDIGSEPGVLQNERPDKNVISHSRTMPRQVKPDDGSEVKLEPDGQLRIITMTGEDKRIVSLEGTDFFNVMRNPQRPFYLHTKSLVTKVLGTNSTAMALLTPKEEAVQVKIGKLSVFANTKELKMVNAVTITPDYQVRFDEVMGKLVKSFAEVPDITTSDLLHPNERQVEMDLPFVMEFERKPAYEILLSNKNYV